MVHYCRSCGDPEDEYCRVQRIHEINGKEYFGMIPFPERKDLLSLFIHFYFFKEKEINAHRHQENAPDHTHFCFIKLDAVKEFCKYITDKHEGDITCRNTQDKGQPSAMT